MRQTSKNPFVSSVVETRNAIPLDFARGERKWAWVILLLIATMMLASCVAGGGRPSDRERFSRVVGKPDANPSAVVRAELAFARLAQEEGQWTAFRETATRDAVMFVPDLQNAQQWLKDQTDPPQAVTWQPHKITISCDGSLALSQGAWQNARGGTGKFWTIWEQQEFGKRRPDEPVEWKWVFDHGVPADTPIAEPDFVETEVANCTGNPPVAIASMPTGGRQIAGRSVDGTLRWAAVQRSDGTRRLSLSLWDGQNQAVIVSEDFGANTE